MNHLELKNLIKNLIKENIEENDDPIISALRLNKYFSNDDGITWSLGNSNNKIVYKKGNLFIQIGNKTPQTIPPFLGDLKNRLSIAMFIDSLVS